MRVFERFLIVTNIHKGATHESISAYYPEAFCPFTHFEVLSRRGLAIVLENDRWYLKRSDNN